MVIKMLSTHSYKDIIKSAQSHHNWVQMLSKNHDQCIREWAQMLSTHTHEAINICSWIQHQNSTSEHRSYQHMVMNPSQRHHKWAQMLSTHGHEVKKNAPEISRDAIKKWSWSDQKKTSEMSTDAIHTWSWMHHEVIILRQLLPVEDRDPWRIRKIRTHLKCTMHCKYKLYLMK